MKRARVVIGAGLGDEGKGLLTDFFVNRYGGDCLVVRFNGGAQAGHTVTLPTGERHVFGHFGAGTLAGAPTYLSRFFVVNPILFFKERDQLGKVMHGRLPEVYVDRDALLTTPYDMLLNQILEQDRGDARHGSCGIGFGETIERCLDPHHRTTVADLLDPPRFAAKIVGIRDLYVPQRLRQLGITELPERFEALLADTDLSNRFVQDALLFSEEVIITGIETLTSAGKVVFEGAQGLLLDEFHPWFPHVTRSRTGLPNVVILAREAGIQRLDVTYVTRAYLTRHGAGPLPFELPGKPYDGIEDRTNIHNAYQGSLRFAWLNLDLLDSAVKGDLRSADGLEIRPDLAITCLDQVGQKLKYVHKGRIVEGASHNVVEIASRMLGFSGFHTGRGPSRSTIDSGFLSQNGLLGPPLTCRSLGRGEQPHCCSPDQSSYLNGDNRGGNL